MGISVTAGLAFKLKRLTREYGTHSHGSIGRLSVSGTVPPIDVYTAFVDCHSYTLAILNCLFKRRFDYDAVKAVLKQLIADEVEVIPQSFVVKRSHQSMYDNCHECISVINVILIWIFF